MKAWKLLSFMLGVLLLACSYNVKYDYDSRAPYSMYKTFDWYASSRLAKEGAKGVPVDNQIMDRRVAGAVERELVARGYTRETGGDPDFLVNYYPVYRDVKYRTATQLGWGSWGFRPWGFGMGVGTTVVQTHQYQEGTIVLEIVDFKTNQLVWKASAEGVLTDLRTPEDADEVVDNAVKRMLSQFPPTRK